MMRMRRHPNIDKNLFSLRLFVYEMRFVYLNVKIYDIGSDVSVCLNTIMFFIFKRL